MKARALVLGIVVSVLLLGVAGALYALSAGGAERQYRAAVPSRARYSSCLRNGVWRLRG